MLGSSLDLGAYEAGAIDLGYFVWIAESLAEGSPLAPAADADGDGISNLREYGSLSAPGVWTSDPQIGELVTNESSGENHLSLTFPHRVDATDLIVEVRAALEMTELADGGNHSVVYRQENGVVTVPSGPGFGITIDPAFLAKAKNVTTI